jgi:AraC-like DNA-binding protein
MRAPVSFVTGFSFDLMARMRYPPHRHRALEIVFHASGSGALHLPRLAAIPFAAGEASICPSGQAHHQEMETAGTDLCILLTLRADPADPADPPTQVMTTRGTLGKALCQEIIQLAEGPTATTPEERVELDLRAATVLAGVMARAQPCGEAVGAAALARDAAHHLTTHYATIGSLSDVARTLAVSASRLRRDFSAHHGESMVRYLNRIRVDRAKELLAHSPLSLRQIAGRCGFSSEQYLCAVFARLERMPPGAFRATRSPR